MKYHRQYSEAVSIAVKFIYQTNRHKECIECERLFKIRQLQRDALYADLISDGVGKKLCQFHRFTDRTDTLDPVGPIHETHFLLKNSFHFRLIQAVEIGRASCKES